MWCFYSKWIAIQIACTRRSRVVIEVYRCKVKRSSFWRSLNSVLSVRGRSHFQNPDASTLKRIRETACNEFRGCPLHSAGMSFLTSPLWVTERGRRGNARTGCWSAAEVTIEYVSIYWKKDHRYAMRHTRLTHDWLIEVGVIILYCISIQRGIPLITNGAKSRSEIGAKSIPSFIICLSICHPFFFCGTH